MAVPPCPSLLLVPVPHIQHRVIQAPSSQVTRAGSALSSKHGPGRVQRAPPGSAVFETLADRPLSGAVLDVPLTRGYATLGDGVLEFTDEEHGPSRLTFAADDVEARPPCPLLLACHRGSTVPSAGAERMPRVHEVLGAGDAGCVGRLPGARTADTCLAFSKRRSQGRRAYQHYGATTMLGQCRAPARLPFVGQPAQVAGLDP